MHITQYSSLDLADVFKTSKADERKAEKMEEKEVIYSLSGDSTAEVIWCSWKVLDVINDDLHYELLRMKGKFIL